MKNIMIMTVLAFGFISCNEKPEVSAREEFVKLAKEYFVENTGKIAKAQQVSNEAFEEAILEGVEKVKEQAKFLCPDTKVKEMTDAQVLKKAFDYQFMYLAVAQKLEKKDKKVVFSKKDCELML